MTTGQAGIRPEAAEARPVDPSGLRVSVVGVELGGPAPVLLEPGALEPGAVESGAVKSRSAAGSTVDAIEAHPRIDGTPTEARLASLGPDRAVLQEGPDGPSHHVLILAPAAAPAGIQRGVTRSEVIVDGWRFEVDVESAARAALQDRARRGRDEASRSGPTRVHAIIPGVVVSVSVAPGDPVTAGQQLLVVEAMKMQNELRAPRDGTVEQVAVGAGSTIDVGDLLLVLA